MATMKLIPSAYTRSSSTYITTSTTYPPENAYTDTSSTTYARFTHNRSSNSTYYVYLHNFNFSDIPSNATVSSFTIKIKASESALNTNSSYRMSLYNGSTAISNTTVTSSLSTTATIFTFPIPSSLTWSTLKGYENNFRIRIPLRRSSSGTSGYANIYGAEIEVTYTIPVYHTITTTGSNISPSGTSSILEGSNFTLTMSSYDRKPRVYDNGNNVSSSVTQSGSSYVYTITNVVADHDIIIEEVPPDALFIKINGVWKEISNIYIKNSSGWIEQTTIASI